MDQVAPTVSPFKNSYFGGFSPSGFVGKALYWLFPPLKLLNKLVIKYADQTKPNPDYRFYWLSPYVYFSARASNKGHFATGPLGNFAQPDVLVGLALQRADYNREQGASKYYGRRFSWNGKGAGSGTVDFDYTAKDWPQIPEMPRNLQVLHAGFNAFAAAQVYYHRPGDWKERV